MKPILLQAFGLLAFGVVHGTEYLVVIDPGHGGAKDSGSEKARTLSASNNATSPSGLNEKDLTLELSLEVAKQLKEIGKTRATKVNCALTRTTDSNPDFAKRAAFCASLKQVPAVIFSIHFNATTKHDAIGSVAVIRQEGKNPNYQADRKFATGLTKAASTGVSRFVPGSSAMQPITDAHLHGGAGSNFFFQLAGHEQLRAVPKCFLEIEFIDRADTEAKLLLQRKAAFPDIARSIAIYLYDYCGSR